MMARSDDHCRHDYAPVAVGYQKSEGAKDVKVHFGQSMRLLNEESRVDHQRGAARTTDDGASRVVFCQPGDDSRRWQPDQQSREESLVPESQNQ